MADSVATIMASLSRVDIDFTRKVFEQSKDDAVEQRL